MTKLLDPKIVAQNYSSAFVECNGSFGQNLPEEWDYCYDLVRNDPINAIALVKELINVSNTITDIDLKYKWIHYIAAGELEDLIADHGDVVINDMFLFACTGVWPRGRDTSDRVWVKFQNNVKFYLQQNTVVLDIYKKYR